MKQKKLNKHEFALFVPTFSHRVKTSNTNNQILFDDPAFVHRLTRVLRLEVESQCIIFDDTHHGLLTITQISTKQITGTLSNIAPHIEITPHITYCVPLLKRDALEQTLYNLTELGINTIQLVYTAKSVHTFSAHDVQRCQRIIQAAGEQAKQFKLPILQDPVPLDRADICIRPQSVPAFFCDPAGTDLLEHIYRLRQNPVSRLVLMSGPEGDLTTDEKALLLQAQVQFCTLTPTILRALQAITLSAGIFRAGLTRIN